MTKFIEIYDDKTIQSINIAYIHSFKKIPGSKRPREYKTLIYVLEGSDIEIIHSKEPYEIFKERLEDLI